MSKNVENGSLGVVLAALKKNDLKNRLRTNFYKEEYFYNAKKSTFITNFFIRVIKVLFFAKVCAGRGF